MHIFITLLASCWKFIYSSAVKEERESIVLETQRFTLLGDNYIIWGKIYTRDYFQGSQSGDCGGWQKASTCNSCKVELDCSAECALVLS